MKSLCDEAVANSHLASTNNGYILEEKERTLKLQEYKIDKSGDNIVPPKRKRSGKGSELRTVCEAWVQAHQGRLWPTTKEKLWILQQGDIKCQQMTNWFTYRRKKAKSNLDRAFTNPRGFVATHGHGVTDTLSNFFVAVAEGKPLPEDGRQLVGNITGLGADRVAEFAKQHQDQCRSQSDGLLKNQDSYSIPHTSKSPLPQVISCKEVVDGLAYPQDSQGLRLSFPQHMVAQGNALQTQSTQLVPYDFTDEQPQNAPQPAARQLPVQLANRTAQLFDVQMTPQLSASVPIISGSTSATSQTLQSDPSPPLQGPKSIIRENPIVCDVRQQEDTQLWKRQGQAGSADKQTSFMNGNFKLELKSTKHLGRRVNLEKQVTPLLQNHNDVQSAISLA
ncbi:hypothetical protein ACHAPA_007609 [Fusarium lateritium]